MEDLIKKIEDFVNGLDYEDENMYVDLFTQRISENEVCISIGITSED